MMSHPPPVNTEWNQYHNIVLQSRPVRGWGYLRWAIAGEDKLPQSNSEVVPHCYTVNWATQQSVETQTPLVIGSTCVFRCKGGNWPPWKCLLPPAWSQSLRLRKWELAAKSSVDMNKEKLEHKDNNGTLLTNYDLYSCNIIIILTSSQKIWDSKQLVYTSTQCGTS